MPALSRQIGSTNQILMIYVQDATSTSGAGLLNVVASSVSASWMRNDQSAVSTVTMTSAVSLGTFSSGGFVQISSSQMAGWYEFGLPNGALVSGDLAGVHLYGAPNMAPLPILIELTKTNNQQFVSSQAFNVGSVLQSPPVTSAAGVLSTDNRSILGTATVTTSAGILATVFDLARTANNNSTVAFSSVSFSSVSVAVSGVNVTSVAGTAVVTSAAGVLATTFDLARTANINSTVAFSSVSFSSVSVAVSGVNVTSVAGSAVVTSAAGVLATTFDLGRTANVNSTVAFSSVSFSSVAVSVGGVNVTSVAGSPVVTSAAGVLATTFDLARIANPTSTVVLTNLTISSTQVVSATVGSVNVSSVNGSAIVTSSAGVIATAFDLSRIVNPTSSVALTNLTISPAQTVTTVAGLNAALLDVSVSSRAAAGSAMTLTAAERAAVANTVNTSTMAESFRGINAAGSVIQLQYEILANLTQFTNANTTRTLNSVTSGVANTITYGYDSSSIPSAISRTA